MKAKIIESKYGLKVLSFLIIFLLIYSRHKISTDDITQLSTTVNFLNGFGFCIKYYNGEYIIHQSVDSWPILYRIIAIPFILITNNIEISAMLIKVFSYLFLFFTLHSLFSCLFTAKKQANIAMNICFLFCTISITPFNYGGVTDILSVCLVLFCFLFLYKFYFLENNPKYIILFSFSIIMLINLRYAYISIVFLILLCVLFLEIKFKTLKSNLLIKLLFSSMLILNLFFILTNNYFLEYAEVVYSSVVNKSTIWSYYYSIFCAPFFPDYIILNAINKFIIVNNVILYIFFSIIILLTFSIGCLIFKACYKHFINSKFKAFFLEGSLVACVIINLSSLFLTFGAFGTYAEKDIEDLNYFTNALLATQNRYELLAIVAIFILVIYYTLFHKRKIFKYILIISFIFNFLHFIYLNNHYSFSRYNNMKITSLPYGSYNDCININKLLMKNNNYNILFVENYTESSTLLKRQINPGKYVVSSGITLMNKLKSTKNALHLKKTNEDFFDKIVYCDYSLNSEFYLKEYNCLYAGNVFSLFEKNAK